MNHRRRRIKKGKERKDNYYCSFSVACFPVGLFKRKVKTRHGEKKAQDKTRREEASRQDEDEVKQEEIVFSLKMKE